MKPKAITSTQKMEGDRLGAIFSVLETLMVEVQELKNAREEPPPLVIDGKDLELETLREEINSLHAMLDFNRYLLTTRPPTWTDKLHHWWWGKNCPSRIEI
jgi:hypothetical protein